MLELYSFNHPVTKLMTFGIHFVLLEWTGVNEPVVFVVYPSTKFILFVAFLCVCLSYPPSQETAEEEIDFVGFETQLFLPSVGHLSGSEPGRGRQYDSLLWGVGAGHNCRGPPVLAETFNTCISAIWMFYSQNIVTPHVSILNKTSTDILEMKTFKKACEHFAYFHLCSCQKSILLCLRKILYWIVHQMKCQEQF